MAVDSSDKKLFISIVNRQRKERRTTLSQLFVDDYRHLTTEEAMRSYFEKSATRVENHTYDENVFQLLKNMLSSTVKRYMRDPVKPILVY